MNLYLRCYSKMRLVHGVGLNDGKKRCVLNGVQVPEYVFWKGMLKRCYCEKYKKKYPTYAGCSVSDNFKSYSYFYDWCHKQIGFDGDNWQLDKDLLLRGNKLYSEELCVFLPNEINSLIRIRTSKKGDLPMGVSVNPWSGRFFSKMRKNGKMFYIGTYDDPESAFFAYKKAKEDYVQSVVGKYKGVIDDRAYDTLSKFEVNIED